MSGKNVGVSFECFVLLRDWSLRGKQNSPISIIIKSFAQVRKLFCMALGERGIDHKEMHTFK